MDATEAWLALKGKSGEELLAEFICPVKREFWLPPPKTRTAVADASVLEEKEEKATTITTTTAAAAEEEEPEEQTPSTSTSTSTDDSRKLASRLRLREARSLKQCREWARSAECPWGDECIYAHGDKPGKVSRGGGGGGNGGEAGAAGTAAAKASSSKKGPLPLPPLPGRCPVDAAWPGSCEFAKGVEGEEGGKRCRWAIHGEQEEEEENGTETKVELLCSLRRRFPPPFSPSHASSSTTASSALPPATRTALFDGNYDFSPSISVLDSLGLSHGVAGKFAALSRARAQRRRRRRKKEEEAASAEAAAEEKEAEDDEAAAASASLAAASLADDNDNDNGREGEEEKDIGTFFYRETGLHPRERAAASSSLALDLRDKLYLAPLTTVGNLPFRALAVSLGADVTCSEMALANNLLQGKGQEWALLKRHSSERLWGVQIAGGHADALARAAQLVSDATDADFLDINMGCPIDLVAHKGAGAGLLARPKKIQALVRAVSRVLTHPRRLRDLPLTIKVRKGVKDGADSVHSWLPSVARGEWGPVAAATVHGRSKQQRYSKDSDWLYVRQCARACSAVNPAFQTISSGDVSCFREYEAVREATAGAVAGVMLARGALVKPWLFTEIKERRDIDLSSSERLELYKNFVSLGLAHWGSDARGVETTRRFFLEWMGFAHRYVPVGLLEEEALQRDAERAAAAARATAASAAAASAATDAVASTTSSEATTTPVSPPPASSSWVSPSARRMLRLRTPRFSGRDDLETLLASTDPADWVRVGEMLLGKAPAGSRFEPKHKSNAYSASAALDGDVVAAAMEEDEKEKEKEKVVAEV